MKELLIFYFSGTGNARQVAQWIKDDVMEKGVNCSLYDITQHDINEITIDNEACIGIISPVHGFNYPPIMLNFISRFRSGHNRVILMNTRAGMKIGHVVTPGLTGIAFLLSAIILSIKGYKVIGMVPFDMPSNWLSLHPALRGKAVDYIFETNHQRVKKHLRRIEQKGHDFTALREIIQDLIISPIALLYYAIGRFFIAKTFYASDSCLHCDMCIKHCPTKVIIKKTNHPYWTFKCESCMKCMNLCPTRSIETSHGLVVITVLCTLLLSSSALYAMLPSIFNNQLVSFITINVFLFVLMGILYRVQHILITKKYIGKAIRLFSLTHFKWWGRYRRNGRL